MTALVDLFFRPLALRDESLLMISGGTSVGSNMAAETDRSDPSPVAPTASKVLWTSSSGIGITKGENFLGGVPDVYLRLRVVSDHGRKALVRKFGSDESFALNSQEALQMTTFVQRLKEADLESYANQLLVLCFTVLTMVENDDFSDPLIINKKVRDFMIGKYGTATGGDETWCLLLKHSIGGLVITKVPAVAVIYSDAGINGTSTKWPSLNIAFDELNASRLDNIIEGIMSNSIEEINLVQLKLQTLGSLLTTNMDNLLSSRLDSELCSVKFVLDFLQGESHEIIRRILHRHIRVRHSGSLLVWIRRSLARLAERSVAYELDTSSTSDAKGDKGQSGGDRSVDNRDKSAIYVEKVPTDWENLQEDSDTPEATMDVEMPTTADVTADTSGDSDYVLVAMDTTATDLFSVDVTQQAPANFSIDTSYGSSMLEKFSSTTATDILAATRRHRLRYLIDQLHFTRNEQLQAEDGNMTEGMDLEESNSDTLSEKPLQKTTKRKSSEAPLLYENENVSPTSALPDRKKIERWLSLEAYAEAIGSTVQDVQYLQSEGILPPSKQTKLGARLSESNVERALTIKEKYLMEVKEIAASMSMSLDACLDHLSKQDGVRILTFQTVQCILCAYPLAKEELAEFCKINASDFEYLIQCGIISNELFYPSKASQDTALKSYRQDILNHLLPLDELQVVLCVEEKDVLIRLLLENQTFRMIVCNGNTYILRSLESEVMSFLLSDEG